MRLDSYCFKKIIVVFIILTCAGNMSITMADGKTVYNTTCIACHAEDGKGALPGVPDLTDRAGRLSKPQDELFNNVINGFQSSGSPMAMPAKGGNTNLTDDDVLEVLNFMRQAFLNNHD